MKRNDLEKLFIAVCILVLFKKDTDTDLPDPLYVLEKIGTDFDTSIYYTLDSSKRQKVLNYFKGLGVDNVLKKVGLSSFSH